MSADIARRGLVAARARAGGGWQTHASSYAGDEPEGERDDEEPACKRARFVTLDDDTMNNKKAKHARYPQEVMDDPANNHLDVVYYMDCVCALLKQLMHKEEGAAEELRRYAQAHKEHRQRSRGNRFFGATTASADGLPKLLHRKPEAPAFTKTRTLGGAVRDVADEKKKTVKPGRQIGGQATKPQGSLASKLGRAAPPKK